MWKHEAPGVAGSHPTTRRKAVLGNEADTWVTERGTQRTSVFDDAIEPLIQTISEACPISEHDSGRGQEVSFVV